MQNFRLFLHPFPSAVQSVFTAGCRELESSFHVQTLFDEHNHLQTACGECDPMGLSEDTPNVCPHEGMYSAGQWYQSCVPPAWHWK